MTVGDFLIAVMEYCHLTMGSVTSYGRTPRHNKAVDGQPFSAHQAWLAVDVVYDDEQGQQWRAEWARRLGLLRIVEHDHDHLQPVTWKAG